MSKNTNRERRWNARESPAIGRRRFVELGALMLPAWFGLGLLTPRSARAALTQARSCVWLWMNGGPSHIDTFDPKPGTTSGGPFKSLRTRAPGVEICEHLPELADRADRFALIRSMTSREGNHDRARYLVHTGYAPTPTVLHPSMGGWVDKEIDHRDLELPAFVSINGPSMGAGFLGVEHAPFVLRNAERSPDNVELPRQVDEDRFSRRQGLLGGLESDFMGETGDPKVRGRRSVYSSAVRMMHSSRLVAFDISHEPANVRAAYGDHDFGKGCLMARRLVEAGVPFVEVTLDGWDTHKDNFDRTKRLMGMLDSGAASLFRELEERRLLDSTIVVVAGEFGRTPKINGNDGRDHHPQAWSALVGGGGVRGGQVIGRTDADGGAVVERPVAVPDLMASLATLMGIDPDKTVLTPVGRPISLTDHGKPIRELIGG
jgi:hypothetical protein